MNYFCLNRKNRSSFVLGVIVVSNGFLLCRNSKLSKFMNLADKLFIGSITFLGFYEEGLALLK